MTREEQHTEREWQEEQLWRLEKELASVEREVDEAIETGECSKVIELIKRRDSLRQRITCNKQREAWRKDGKSAADAAGFCLKGGEIDELFNR